MLRVNQLIQRYGTSMDRELKSILSSPIQKTIQANSIPLLVSQPVCRPATLTYLIHLYNQEHHPTKKEFSDIMSKSLLAFVKNQHPNQSENKILRVIGILQTNGADPYYKDQYGRNVFDYARQQNNTYMLDVLLCLCPKNPIRMIRSMLKQERETRNRLDMIEFLKDIQYDFNTEQGFSEARLPYHLLQIRSANHGGSGGERMRSRFVMSGVQNQ